MVRVITDYVLFYVIISWSVMEMRFEPRSSFFISFSFTLSFFLFSFFYNLSLQILSTLESDLDGFNYHFDCFGGSLPLLDLVIIR